MPLLRQQCSTLLHLFKAPLLVTLTRIHQAYAALTHSLLAAVRRCAKRRAWMEWLWSAKRSSSGEQALAPAQKLKEYHDLAKVSWCNAASTQVTHP